MNIAHISLSMPVIFLGVWAFLCILVLIIGWGWMTAPSKKTVAVNNAPDDALLKKNQEILDAMIGKLNFTLEKLGQVEADLRSVKNEGAASREQIAKDALRMSNEFANFKTVLTKMEEKAAAVPPPPIPVQSKETVVTPKAEPEQVVEEKPTTKVLFPHAHVTQVPAQPAPQTTPVPSPAASILPGVPPQPAAQASGGPQQAPAIEPKKP